MTTNFSREAFSQLQSAYAELSAENARLTARIAELEREKKTAYGVANTHFLDWQSARAEVERLRSLMEPCEVHHGARRSCGQCLSSTEQHLKNARAEVESLKAKVSDKTHVAHGMMQQRDEALAEVESLRAQLAEARTKFALMRGVGKAGDQWQARAEAAEEQLRVAREALYGLIGAPGYVDLPQLDRDRARAALAAPKAEPVNTSEPEDSERLTYRNGVPFVPRADLMRVAADAFTSGWHQAKLARPGEFESRRATAVAGLVAEVTK